MLELSRQFRDMSFNLATRITAFSTIFTAAYPQAFEIV